MCAWKYYSTFTKKNSKNTGLENATCIMEQRSTNNKADSGNDSIALLLLNTIEWFSQKEKIALLKKKLIAFPHSTHEVHVPNSCYNSNPSTLSAVSINIAPIVKERWNKWKSFHWAQWALDCSLRAIIFLLEAINQPSNDLSSFWEFVMGGTSALQWNKIDLRCNEVPYCYKMLGPNFLHQVTKTCVFPHLF